MRTGTAWKFFRPLPGKGEGFNLLTPLCMYSDVFNVGGSHRSREGPLKFKRKSRPGINKALKSTTWAMLGHVLGIVSLLMPEARAGVILMLLT
jgi:hypothetical protein